MQSMQSLFRLAALTVLVMVGNMPAAAEDPPPCVGETGCWVCVVDGCAIGHCGGEDIIVCEPE